MCIALKYFNLNKSVGDGSAHQLIFLHPLSEMNRHHYALYVHNCRLVFLLRKDFDQADTFRPAEFHWKLDQVLVAFSYP